VQLAVALTLVSGIAWTIVYIEAARIGFRDRTYAMPVAALALNLAWEWTYAARSMIVGSSLLGVIELVWGLADLLIVYTYLRYGRAELPPFVTRWMFIGWSVLLLAISFAVQLLFLAHFGAKNGGGYSAFLQNLLMSGLFIAMFVARGGGLRGQSLTIAVAKCLGTLAPTLLYGVVFHTAFYLVVGIACGALDVVYVGLCRQAKRTGRAALA
jgi:hypothetical protein